MVGSDVDSAPSTYWSHLNPDCIAGFEAEVRRVERSTSDGGALSRRVCAGG